MLLQEKSYSYINKLLTTIPEITLISCLQLIFEINKNACMKIETNFIGKD